MDWMDEEFFDESDLGPEEAAVVALKNAIKANIRADIRAEVERLRRENRGLQDIRSRWDALTHELSMKEQQLRLELKNARQTARKERLNQLLAASDACVWGVHREYAKGPKCDRCDGSRRVAYTDPFGRPERAKCPCDEWIGTYVVKPYMCTQARFEGSDRTVAFYQVVEVGGRDEYLKLDGVSTLRGRIFAVGEESPPFAELQWDGSFFRDQAACQSYCNWLNHQKGA